MAHIGYARVSAADQNHDGQVERLMAAGCEQVYTDKASGKSTNGRSGLGKALKALKQGDTLVITRLDRLARSIRDLLNLIDLIEGTGAHIKALDDAWLDTGSPQGELILTIMGALAEFERKLIRARCDEGIRRAKERGTQFGRKPTLDPSERRRVAERYGKGETMRSLALDYGCSEATICRVVNGVTR